MKIVNKQQMQSYEDEKQMLAKRHEEALAELEARKPQPIELTEHQGEQPKTLGKGLVVMPGGLHGVDHNGQPLAIHSDDIGPDGYWEKVQ
jgi:hypothetical protein